MKEKQTNNKLNKKVIIVGALIVLAVVIIFMILFFNKEEKYTIKFEANGGSAVASIIIDKDGTAEKPEDPVKPGYIFAGWYYNDEPFNFSEPITSDMELEARWVVDTDAEDVEDKEDLEDDDTEKEDKKDNEKVEDKKEDNKVEDNKENNKVEDNKEEQPKEDPKEDDKEEEKEDEKIVVTGVSLNRTSLTLTEGESSKLSATVNPNNATNKNVTWSSSDTSVATVDANGNVTAKKVGTATITVTTTDGNKTSTCTVTVNEKPASYVVSFTPKSLYEGGPTVQYSVVVTKNGSVCDYKHIIYNGEKLGKYPDAGKLSTKLSTATVRLTDGTDVTASVVFK